MSDLIRFEAAIRDSLSEIRALEPSSSEVQGAIRAVAGRRPGRQRARHAITAIALAFGLVTGTALAIPQTREGVLDVFGEVADFLTGGGDPPGQPVRSNADRLSWFEGLDPATGRVVARSNGKALVAFRGRRGLACLSHTSVVEECLTDDDWRLQLASSNIVVRGPWAERDPGGRQWLTGIVVDEVRAIELVYADGAVERAGDVLHGFIIFADPLRDPVRLVGLDASGGVVESVDISGLQWRDDP